jgi:hypothetical protein
MSHHPTSWRKSSYSVNGTQCVELAEAGRAVWVRDSKRPGHGHLAFSRSELAAFVAACRAGEYDDLV